LKKLETKKLFYNEYKYKLVFRTRLSRYLRGSDFKKSLRQLTNFVDESNKKSPANQRKQLSNLNRLRDTLSQDEVAEVTSLLKEFSKASDFRLRIEYNTVGVFSNNKTWLKKIARMANNAKEFYEPLDESLLTDPNVIVLKRPIDFEYRVTLASNCKVDTGFADWVATNTDKVKATQWTLQKIRRGVYVGGLYFYARDKKIVNLIQLMIGNMGRVDKVIYADDKDK